MANVNELFCEHSLHVIFLMIGIYLCMKKLSIAENSVNLAEMYCLSCEICPFTQLSQIIDKWGLMTRPNIGCQMTHGMIISENMAADCFQLYWHMLSHCLRVNIPHFKNMLSCGITEGRHCQTWKHPDTRWLTGQYYLSLPSLQSLYKADFSQRLFSKSGKETSVKAKWVLLLIKGWSSLILSRHIIKHHRNVMFCLFNVCPFNYSLFIAMLGVWYCFKDFKSECAPFNTLLKR